MGNTGGVLTRTQKSFLFNRLINHADIGAYVDSVEGGNKLILKTLGYTIPMNAQTKLTMSCNDPGARRGILLTLEAKAPCNECNYEYGITVKSSHQYPGRFNSDSVPRTNVYSGSIASVETDQGFITSTYLRMMEKDLIKQINTYIPMNTDGIMPAQLATRFVILKDLNTTTNTVLGVTVNGVTTVLTANGHATLVKEILDKTTLSAMYMGDPSGASYTFAVWSEKGDWFELDTTHADVEVVQESMLILSRENKLHIAVESNPSIGKIEGINIVKFFTNSGGAATTYDITFSSNSAVDAIRRLNSPCGVNAAFVFGNRDHINNLSTWFLTKDGNQIFGYSANDEAYVTYMPGDMEVSLVTKTGSWEKLSTDDVFREFAHNPNFGGLSAQVYRNIPTEGTRYCKLVIEWNQEIADLVGANHMNGHRQSIALYFPMDKKCVLAFQSNNAMGVLPVTPDRTLYNFINGYIGY